MIIFCMPWTLIPWLTRKFTPVKPRHPKPQHDVGLFLGFVGLESRRRDNMGIFRIFLVACFFLVGTFAEAWRSWSLTGCFSAGFFFSPSNPEKQRVKAHVISTLKKFPSALSWIAWNLSWKFYCMERPVGFFDRDHEITYFGGDQNPQHPQAPENVWPLEIASEWISSYFILILLMVQKSCIHLLSLVVNIPFFRRFFFIQGGCLGFLPSAVFWGGSNLLQHGSMVCLRVIFPPKKHEVWVGFVLTHDGSMGRKIHGRILVYPQLLRSIPAYCTGWLWLYLLTHWSHRNEQNLWISK